MLGTLGSNNEAISGLIDVARGEALLHKIQTMLIESGYVPPRRITDAIGS